jgi:acetaldehyde dehydrogenase / alcohol dehydrogenase
MPLSLEECGIDQTDYESKICSLALHAFNDPDTNVNPKRPLMRELADILHQAYKEN